MSAGVQVASSLVMRAVRTRWPLIVVTAVVAVAVALGVALLRPRVYTVRTSFSAESRRGPNSQLAGLAAQLGVGLGGGDGSQSPTFYLDLIQSPVVLKPVIDAHYVLEGGRRGSYADLTEVTGRSPADRRAAALIDLRRRFGAALAPKTGVISVVVTTRSPLLSKQIADTLLSALNDFNLRRRQSQAGQERRFVERRLAEARADLGVAESRLEQFLTGNRMYQMSPDLTLQHDRLEREVSLRQSLLTTLSQSYEVARIDEVRDTPVLAVVEPPELPQLPDPRRPWALVLFAALAGTGAGMFVAVVRTRAAEGRGRGVLPAPLE